MRQFNINSLYMCNLSIGFTLYFIGINLIFKHFHLRKKNKFIYHLIIRKSVQIFFLLI